MDNGIRIMKSLPLSINTPKPSAIRMRDSFSAPVPIIINEAHAARYPIPGAFRSVKLNHKEEQNKRKR